MANNSIIASLDAFIRKYYKNQLIKGGIYAATLLFSLFLVVVLLEHFGYFSMPVRALLFWLYVVAMLLVLAFYVVKPLTKMCKLGKRISYDEAARIIGDYFPEVKDKLLNLLQLQQMGESTHDELLQASIEQKTLQLKPVPFLNAINLKANVRYLKWAAIPILLVVLGLIFAPRIVTQPAKRLIHYNTFYERPAPFSFVVENDTLAVVRQEDFLLRVAVVGDAVPAEAFIVVDGKEYKMQSVDKTHFTYLFNKVQQTSKFSLHAADVSSPEYLLIVHPNPVVVNFQASLSYPAYTNRKAEVLSNEGDLTVPEGTMVKWLFQTKDVDTLHFLTNEKWNSFAPDANGRQTVAMRAMQSFSYAFTAVNSSVLQSDTVRYGVTVIPDAAPMIVAMEMRDSLYEDRLFFKGRIKDDYGFSKLQFKIVRSNVSDTSKKTISAYDIALSKESAQEFQYTVNMAELVLSPGDKLEYYFEVWDNDAIHGPKSSTSQHFEVAVPTEEELENTINQNSTDIQRKAETSMSELKKLQDEINELMRKLVDKKELGWQDKKDLQQLYEKQKEVKDMLNKMQQQIQENNRLEQKYKEQNEQIMEKQRELDKLFNEVMNDEMKKMMQEMDKLMQEMDKKKVQEQLENLKMDNAELEKQLDQNIELMKRLEMEKKVETAIQKMDKLAEQQRELSQKTEEAKGKDKESLMKQQKEVSDHFKELQKDLQQIKEEYKEIDKDINFNTGEQLQKEIEKAQQEAQNQLQKGKNKEASKQQKSAAEDMEKLSEQLAESQMDAEQEDLAEDSEMIRRLLKNLVQLSFNQEELISKANNTYIQDPKYQGIIADQNKIKDDFRMVEDSLRAVAKRQINVAAAIVKEVGAVNSNITKSLSNLLEFNQSFYGNSKNGGASRPMQYAMTSINNLSLVLAESLDQMQNQMRQNQQKKNQGSCKRQGMKKQGNCSNPGKGKPSAKSMKQMQDELNKQMEALKKQLDKQGSNPGRTKIGEKGSMSEEFAKMAAQQEMIRRMMQEYGQELKQSDAGNSKLAKEIDNIMRQMEQTETDLVNKTITQQTIRRQQQIMSRLLEHEKAEMQREKEERRESKEAKDQYQPSQSDLEKYNKLKDSNVELFRALPPTLSPYYKNKVSDYFYKF